MGLHSADNGRQELFSAYKIAIWPQALPGQKLFVKALMMDAAVSVVAPMRVMPVPPLVGEHVKQFSFPIPPEPQKKV